MPLKINIDVEAIAKEFKDFAKEVEQHLMQGVKQLAVSTNAHVREEAERKIKSQALKQKFIKGVTYEEIAEGLHVVSIDESVLFIEDGLPAGFDMKPGLLNSPKAKMSKDGHKYISVPFEHSAAPSTQSDNAKDLAQRIKGELRKANVPFKKIEYNKDGSPKLGKLHDLNFGGEIPGKGNTPIMKGVTVYQTMTASGNVRRDIFTFRTVSDNPASEGKWMHPGIKPKHFLEDAMQWAMNEWETNILPDILGKWK